MPPRQAQAATPRNSHIRRRANVERYLCFRRARQQPPSCSPSSRCCRTTRSACRRCILRLALDNGQIVGGKLRYLKDPSTGRRVSRPNPPEEWRRTPAPKLRIVEPVLWETVQARLAGRAKSPAGYLASTSSSAVEDYKLTLENLSVLLQPRRRRAPRFAMRSAQSSEPSFIRPKRARQCASRSSGRCPDCWEKA